MANILIVEDEKALQDIVADYLRKGGHTCFTADDGVDYYMTKPFSPRCCWQRRTPFCTVPPVHPPEPPSPGKSCSSRAPTRSDWTARRSP